MKDLTIIIIDPDNRASSETAVTLQNAGFNCAVFSDIGDSERQLETIGVGCFVVSLAFGKEKISEFVSKIVTNKRYRHIPLVGILADDPEAYLKLGNCRHDFFHFLEASPSAHALTQVVESGFSSYEHYVSLVSEIRSRTSAIGLITSGTFHLKSPKECENLTTMLSLACPDPSAVALGLSELLINAVEHGNLGISYQEKTALLDEGTWDGEVAKRLHHPDNRDKVVEVHFERNNGHIRIRVTDEGDGFDWRAFMSEKPITGNSHHGRGISLARLMGFNDLQYNKAGNSVLAIIDLGSDDLPEVTANYHI